MNKMILLIIFLIIKSLWSSDLALERDFVQVFLGEYNAGFRDDLLDLMSRKIPCDEDEKYVEDNRFLVTVERIPPPLGRYHCIIARCTYWTHYKDYFELHKRIHRGVKSFRCIFQECGSVFTRNYSLNQHVKKAHSHH